jgi:hypothetical protein
MEGWRYRYETDKGKEKEGDERILISKGPLY